MEFSAKNSTAIWCKCGTTPGELEIDCGQSCYLGLNVSCILNFWEHALTRVANTSKLVGMLHITLKLEESKLHSFGTYIRLIPVF